jgi:hypothetical protein
MKDLLDQERIIDQEIQDELEKYRMERELLGGLDLEDDSSGDINRLIGDHNDEFDINNENQPVPINIVASNSRDTSMISASGASSSQ